MMLDKHMLHDASDTPLYIQLANNLRTHIATGGISSGEALPSERDLSDHLGASRVTIRKAIGRLIAEGLLFRKQGSGTFVSAQIEAPGSFLSGFSEDAGARGAKSGSIWMMKSYAAPTDEESLLLELDGDVQVARLGRVRLSGGEPLAIEHAVVPASMLPDLAALGDSLYDALDSRGNRPVSGTQKIRASLATPTEAGLLSIAEHSEVLRLERLTRTANGTPVELTRSAYRGDRYVFVSEMRGIYSVL
jgi:GntR family transcriptional regulator